jgi:MFS family permease
MLSRAKAERGEAAQAGRAESSEPAGGAGGEVGAAGSCGAPLRNRSLPRRAVASPFETQARRFRSAVALPLVGAATSWLHVVLLRTAALAGRGFRSPLRDQLLSRAVPPSRRGAAFGLERAMDQAGGLLAAVAISALLAHGVSVRQVLWADRKSVV